MAEGKSKKSLRKKNLEHIVSDSAPVFLQDFDVLGWPQSDQILFKPERLVNDRIDVVERPRSAQSRHSHHRNDSANEPKNENPSEESHEEGQRNSLRPVVMVSAPRLSPHVERIEPMEEEKEG